MSADADRTGSGHMPIYPGLRVIAGTGGGGINFTIPDEPWMSEALCAQADPEAWFPEKGGSGAVEAKRICAACPVKNECLTYALDNDEHYGIYGGFSQRERRRIKQGLPVRALKPPKPVAPPVICPHCHEHFRPAHAQSLYCSEWCKNLAQRQRLNNRRKAARQRRDEVAG